MTETALVEEIASRLRNECLAVFGNTWSHDVACRFARAALSGGQVPAYAEAYVGDWKLVPVEPTEEMIEAGGDCPQNSVLAEAYRAMLLAVPEPPASCGYRYMTDAEELEAWRSSAVLRAQHKNVCPTCGQLLSAAPEPPASAGGWQEEVRRALKPFAEAARVADWEHLNDGVKVWSRLTPAHLRSARDLLARLPAAPSQPEPKPADESEVEQAITQMEGYLTEPTASANVGRGHLRGWLIALQNMSARHASLQANRAKVIEECALTVESFAGRLPAGTRHPFTPFEIAREVRALAAQTDGGEGLYNHPAMRHRP
jgi:hypothetical protein